MWLLGRLAALGTAGAPELLLRLLRWRGGGSRRSRWLAEQLVVEHQSWVTEYPEVVAGVVYCLLGQVEEHMARETKQEVEGLASREAVLAVALVREAPRAAATLGRELVRPLQQVARVSEVLQLWQDVLEQCLAPNLTLEALLRTSAPPQAPRPPPHPCRGGPAALPDPAGALRSAEQVRGVVPESAPGHPRVAVPEAGPGEVAGGRRLPDQRGAAERRDAAVGGGGRPADGLHQPGGHTKLALFCLSFDPSIDSIMTVEPAALLMKSTVKSHPHLLPSLLDFLLRLGPAFLPAAAAQVEASGTAAWRALVDR